MRVLMITLGYPKHPGDPTAPFIDAIAHGIADRGHTVDIVLPFHPEFRQADKEGIHFFPYRYSPIRAYSPWGFGQIFGPKSRVRLDTAALLPVIALSLRRCISRRLTRERYDVVHAHWVVPNGWLAAPAAHKRCVPIVLTLHGSDVAMAERYKVVGKLAQRTFGLADAVNATSSELLGRAVALGADPERAAPLYLGVDTTLFSPREPDLELRKALGADRDEFLVVSVGRLAEVKGFEHLIDAAALLRDVSVAIVGDGELKADLERRARGMKNVTLVGSMPHHLVADALRAADVVVVPSVVDRAGRVDTTTSTVPEALSSARPLVATNVGGIPEIAEDGRTAILVPPKNPQALAEAITRLRADPGLRQRLAEEGRRFAVERLSWDATAQTLEETYRRAINARARPQSRSDVAR